MGTDVTQNGGKPWAYSAIVKDHFFHPRNLLIDKPAVSFDAYGEVGSLACGDMMRIWLVIDEKTLAIKECKWRTFGCASAIASTSMMSVMVTENGGMSIFKAMRLKPEQIVDRLGGLPDRKFHCSVLGQEALTEAVTSYINKHGIQQANS